MSAFLREIYMDSNLKNDKSAFNDNVEGSYMIKLSASMGASGWDPHIQMLGTQADYDYDDTSGAI